MENNYTLGRGEIRFSRFKPGTQIPSGFRYIGNSPEFALTIESESLDHFNSDRGIREKDLSIALEVTRSGSLVTDNIDPENVALFFFGESLEVDEAAATGVTETLEGVLAGYEYRLGVSTTNTAGYYGVDGTTVVVTDVGAATTFVTGTDYVWDDEIGTLKIIDGGAIASGDDIVLTYDVRASTRARIVSGSEAVEGAMRYTAFNPQGKNIDYYLPYVKITPNGDFNLKSDELQTIPLSIEALKPSSGPAILADGRPVFA